MRRIWIAWIIAALLVLAGLFLFVAVALPYPTLKTLANSLTSDHNFNSLKPWNETVFKIIFSACGLFCLGLGVLSGMRRWYLIGRFWNRFWLDGRRSLVLVRLHKQELGFLACVLVITFLAVIFRMEKANAPLAHDEAYTYLAFSRSLFSALTDYSKPNNHVLHSILVFFSTRIFGMGAWTLRLPAFLAGVLLVPASYWLASRLYDRWTALGAAFLVAWFPPLVSYANDARVHIGRFVHLVDAGAGRTGPQGQEPLPLGPDQPFLRSGSLYCSDHVVPFRRFIRLVAPGEPGLGSRSLPDEIGIPVVLAGSGSGCGIIDAHFLYSHPGLHRPVINFMQTICLPRCRGRISLDTLAIRFADTWTEWTLHVPTEIVILFVIGWVSSLVFHRKIASARIPLQLAALVWFVILILLKRPNAEARFWSFLMPLILIWASAGTFGLLQKIRLKFVSGIPLAGPVFGLMVIYGFWHASWLMPQFPALWAGHGKQEDVVLFVQSRLKPDDLIVVSSPDDAPVWYYSDLHGIPEAFFDINKSDFKRTLVLVDKQWNQTLEWVLADRGPDRDCWIGSLPNYWERSVRSRYLRFRVSEELI